MAPFDVKLGNFTGGSINAVTRSGTNDFHGSIYSFGRNQSITGRSVDGANAKIGDKYGDYQNGFRLGGPIVKDKLFFFVNGEIARRNEPVFFGAGAPGALVSTDLAGRLQSSVRTRYSYNIGDAGDYSIYANSTKLFGRIDFNLNDQTSIALRHNFITSEATNLERTNNLFKFASQDFTQNNVQNSTVLEVKSNFSSRFANNLILGYTNIHDYRNLIGGQANVFPFVQINNVGPSAGVSGVVGANDFFTGSGQVLLGSDREASIFNTRQKTFEITDNFNVYLGAHALTIGTHNELYNIEYGFINSWNGRIEYNNVSDFLRDFPQRVRGSFRNAENGGNNSYDYNYNNPSAAFNVNLYSAYVQDEWTVNDKLRITPGIRFDVASLPTKPLLNAGRVNDPNNDLRASLPGTVGAGGVLSPPTFGYTPFAQLKNDFLGQVQISPRLGFNYDANGDGSLVVRGGTGVFTGRIPFAWLGYAFYNNAVNFNSIDLNNIQTSGAANTNPGGTPTATGVGAGTVYRLSQDPNQIYAQLPRLPTISQTTELNVIDNNFKMPQIWRSSLAVDFKLKTGTRFSLEGLYTQVLQDVKFQNTNLADNTQNFGGPYGANPRYVPYNFPASTTPIGATSSQRVNPNFSNAYLLTNTQEGRRYQLTGSVGQTIQSLLDVSVAYTYGQSKDISNGIRNSFESNWQLNPAQNPNNPALALSNFDLRHRVVGSINLHKTFAERFTGYFTGVFTYSSGLPFSYVYNNNFFGDNQQQVKLAYVPNSATPGEVTLVDRTSVTQRNAAGALVDLRPADASVYASLDNFISNDSYLKDRRGQYTERNAARTPWNNQADVRFMLEAKLGTITANEAGQSGAQHTIQISFDIVNVGNLLNQDWGRQYFVSNTFNSTVPFGLNQVGFADANGALSRNFSTATFNRPAFTYSPLTTTPYSVDQLASRWQGQLGVRYLF